MKKELKLTSSIDLLNKISTLLGLKNAYELANIFGVKPNTVSSWKIRDTIPYDRIIKLCERYSIDLNDLFFDNYSKKQLNDKYVQVPLLQIHHYWDYYFDINANKNTSLPRILIPNAINCDLIIQLVTESKDSLNSTLFFTFCKKITLKELVVGTTYVFIVKNRGFLYAKLQLINTSATLELDLGDTKITHINSKEILEIFVSRGSYSTK